MIILRFTLGVILSKLPFDFEHSRDLLEDPSFDIIELLSASGANLRPDCLFVCSLSEALEMADKHKDIFFLCLRDRMVDASETKEKMHNIIVIKKNMELRELFNHVQGILLQINNWVIALQESVLNNKGLQDILDLSEFLLDNPINVMDSTFKLMAYSKNIPTDDPVTLALLENGYHSPEIVKRFQETRRIEQFENANDVIVSEDHLFSDYTTIKKVYQYGKTYSVLAVMICSTHSPTNGDLYLFRTMLKYLQYYVDRASSGEMTSSQAEYLLCDILNRKLLNETEAKNRAAYANLPYEGVYDLYKLVWSDEGNTPARRIVRELNERLPYATVVIYEKSLLILNMYGQKSGKKQEDAVCLCESVCDQVAHCGISNRFGTLWELPLAHEQCEASIATSKMVMFEKAQGRKEHKRFEGYLLYHMLLQSVVSAPKLYMRSFMVETAKTLREYDESHHTELALILKTYLEYDRRASEACKHLHMHRNTVVYHIGKLEEMLGISLDDPDTRLKLNLLFKMLEIKNFESILFDTHINIRPLSAPSSSESSSLVELWF